MARVKAKPVTTTVSKVVLLRSCPRCLGGHPKLTVRLWKNPPEIVIEDGIIPAHRFTGWTMCPKTKEPILIAIGYGRKLI